MADKKSVTASNKSVALKDSVRTKLIVVMILICVIPLLIATVTNLNSSISKSLEDAETVNLRNASLVQQSYMGEVDQMMSSLRAIASNPDVVKYMTADPADRDNEAMQKWLQYIEDHLQGDNSIVMTAPDGNQVVRSSGDLRSIADRDYFQESVKGKEVISGVYAAKSTGTASIFLIVPIKDANGGVVGTVQRSYSLKFLHQYLADLVDASKKEEAFILDKTGALIGHSDFEVDVNDLQDFSSFEAYTSKEKSGSFQGENNGQKLIMSYQKEESTGWVVVFASNYDTVMAPSIANLRLIIIIGIVLIVIAVLISFKMAGSFTNPLMLVNESVNKLAYGEFKTIDKYTKRKDEFGTIINNTNAVVTKLSDIVSNIKKSTVSVNNSSMDLASMANEISATSEDVANAVQEIAEGATHQANDIQDATESVANIGKATDNVKQSTDELSELAARMQKASKESAKNLENLQISGHRMSDSIRGIYKKIGATSEAVANINGKVEGIASIANQTNLLSLNASIEAARAGEAGRGFAVVAEEIGKLADDSRTMADDIRREMDILLAESKATVEMATDVQKGNDEQSEVLSVTVESVKNMLGDIASTVESVKSIEESAETCVSANETVSAAMESLSSISEENAASSEETGASMQQLSATVTSLASSAESLKDIADKLKADMDFFK